MCLCGCARVVVPVCLCMCMLVVCAVAVYTSSWIAPKSDVHSQQRFFYQAHKGEVTVDQVCVRCDSVRSDRREAVGVFENRLIAVTVLPPTMPVSHLPTPSS